MDLDGPSSAIIEESAFAFDTVAPGDEGFDFSHEGGEYEIYEMVENEVAGLYGRPKYFDRPDRRNHIEISTYHWNIQLDDMVDTYLKYRNEPVEHCSQCCEGHISMGAEGGDTHANLGEPPGTFQSHDRFPNISLLHVGCLGTSPLHPTVAISLCTLELYQQVHRVCPRLTIQAQVRMLCYMHNVPYQSYLCQQFSDAFDIYLEILHHVDLRVSEALGRNGPKWHLWNTCPACFYKLEGEPSLQFSFLCEMDGNNSLKCVDISTRGQAERPDSRNFHMDYWLTPVEVDAFKDEVKVSSSRTSVSDPCSTTEDSDAWTNVDNSSAVFSCIERWHNAGPEQRKRMFAMFAESGIFIVACRHGNILLACDMIQSSELYVGSQ
ncbi:hypothetical protein BJV78DRAFT_1140924 [Lactifluus subvellereus]|nr:hypothetical protein BJV78DRAFT_1140924 [Lactifluus subvellereus]